MIEYLGPTYFTAEEYTQMVTIICQMAIADNPSLRQAATYGIGIIAQSSGNAFGANY
jgi:methylthioribose-1-phosphate isomerase